MLVLGFPAAAMDTNCYVLAPGEGEECVVVDPGIGVDQMLDEILDAHRLRPVAVLLTHGHFDHTMSVSPVCGARHIPAFIHPDDADRLADPLAGLPEQMRQAMGPRLTWTEPTDVRVLSDGLVLDLGGVQLVVDHAPGHTQGSVMFRTPGAVSGVTAEPSPLCVTGDVLFAGSIGRTDLPGGDHALMQASLRSKILPLDDTTVVLPGHGPASTIGRERRVNPYLTEAQLGTVPFTGPSRGL
jgi:hydroxyacylglutathione hydrolase